MKSEKWNDIENPRFYHAQFGWICGINAVNQNKGYVVDNLQTWFSEHSPNHRILNSSSILHPATKATIHSLRWFVSEAQPLYERNDVETYNVKILPWNGPTNSPKI